MGNIVAELPVCCHGKTDKVEVGTIWYCGTEQRYFKRLPDGWREIEKVEAALFASLENRAVVLLYCDDEQQPCVEIEWDNNPTAEDAGSVGRLIRQAVEKLFPVAGGDIAIISKRASEIAKAYIEAGVKPAWVM